MIELEFFDFIIKNKIENHTYEIDGEKNTIFFIPFYLIGDFTELMGHSFFCGGRPIILKHDCICIWASIIEEYFGINIVPLFEEKTNENN